MPSKQKTKSLSQGPDLAARVSDAAAKRFGDGKVRVSARTLHVDASLKAFEFDALRAFD